MTILDVKVYPEDRPPHLGNIAGLRAFRGTPFHALGELDVFAFTAAGFLADAFVDLDAFAAGTTARPSLDRLMEASRAGRRAFCAASSSRSAHHQSSASGPA